MEIRILIIDDHVLFRDGLTRLLESEPGFQVVGSCGSAIQAMTLLQQEQVDLVLLDYNLGEERASSFIPRAQEHGFRGRVLIVTGGMSEIDTVEALEKGCSGIVLKHSAPAQLIKAIHEVIAGETWLDPRAVKSLIAGASSKSGEHRTSHPMTNRERAVLKGVLEGRTNPEIARQLDVTENSVKWALHQLFEKTGVRTRGQLVRIALERNWSARDTGV